MESFYLAGLTVAVPLSQIALLVTLSTLALLFRKIKLALIINYLFALYWGYGFNLIIPCSSLQGHPQFSSPLEGERLGEGVKENPEKLF